MVVKRNNRYRRQLPTNSPSADAVILHNAKHPVREALSGEVAIQYQTAICEGDNQEAKLVNIASNQSTSSIQSSGSQDYTSTTQLCKLESKFLLDALVGDQNNERLLFVGYGQLLRMLKPTMKWKQLPTGLVKYVQDFNDTKGRVNMIVISEDNPHRRLLKQTFWKQFNFNHDENEARTVRWTYQTDENSSRIYGLRFLTEERCENFLKAMQNIGVIVNHIRVLKTSDVNVRLQYLKNIFMHARNTEEQQKTESPIRTIHFRPLKFQQTRSLRQRKAWSLKRHSTLKTSTSIYRDGEHKMKPTPLQQFISDSEESSKNVIDFEQCNSATVIRKLQARYKQENRHEKHAGGTCHFASFGNIPNNPESRRRYHLIRPKKLGRKPKENYIGAFKRKICFKPRPSRSVVGNTCSHFFKTLQSKHNVNISPFSTEGLPLRQKAQQLFGLSYVTQEGVLFEGKDNASQSFIFRKPKYKEDIKPVPCSVTTTARNSAANSSTDLCDSKLPTSLSAAPIGLRSSASLQHVTPKRHKLSESFSEIKKNNSLNMHITHNLQLHRSNPILNIPKWAIEKKQIPCIRAVPNIPNHQRFSERKLKMQKRIGDVDISSCKNRANTIGVYDKWVGGRQRCQDTDNQHYLNILDCQQPSVSGFYLLPRLAEDRVGVCSTMSNDYGSSGTNLRENHRGYSENVWSARDNDVDWYSIHTEDELDDNNNFESIHSNSSSNISCHKIVNSVHKLCVEAYSAMLCCEDVIMHNVEMVTEQGIMLVHQMDDTENFLDLTENTISETSDSVHIATDTSEILKDIIKTTDFESDAVTVEVVDLARIPQNVVLLQSLIEIAEPTRNNFVESIHWPRETPTVNDLNLWKADSKNEVQICESSVDELTDTDRQSPKEDEQMKNHLLEVQGVLCAQQNVGSAIFSHEEQREVLFANRQVGILEVEPTKRKLNIRQPTTSYQHLNMEEAKVNWKKAKMSKMLGIAQPNKKSVNLEHLNTEKRLELNKQKMHENKTNPINVAKEKIKVSNELSTGEEIMTELQMNSHGKEEFRTDLTEETWAFDTKINEPSWLSEIQNTSLERNKFLESNQERAANEIEVEDNFEMFNVPTKSRISEEFEIVKDTFGTEQKSEQVLMVPTTDSNSDAQIIERFFTDQEDESFVEPDIPNVNSLSENCTTTDIQQDFSTLDDDLCHDFEIGNISMEQEYNECHSHEPLASDPNSPVGDTKEYDIFVEDEPEDFVNAEPNRDINNVETLSSRTVTYEHDESVHSYIELPLYDIDSANVVTTTTLDAHISAILPDTIENAELTKVLITTDTSDEARIQLNAKTEIEIVHEANEAIPLQAAVIEERRSGVVVSNEIVQQISPNNSNMDVAAVEEIIAAPRIVAELSEQETTNEQVSDAKDSPTEDTLHGETGATHVLEEAEPEANQAENATVPPLCQNAVAVIIMEEGLTLNTALPACNKAGGDCNSSELLAETFGEDNVIGDGICVKAFETPYEAGRPINDSATANQLTDTLGDAEQFGVESVRNKLIVTGGSEFFEKKLLADELGNGNVYKNIGKINSGVQLMTILEQEEDVNETEQSTHIPNETALDAEKSESKASISNDAESIVEEKSDQSSLSTSGFVQQLPDNENSSALDVDPRTMQEFEATNNPQDGLSLQSSGNINKTVDNVALLLRHMNEDALCLRSVTATSFPNEKSTAKTPDDECRKNFRFKRNSWCFASQSCSASRAVITARSNAAVARKSKTVDTDKGLLVSKPTGCSFSILFNNQAKSGKREPSTVPKPKPAQESSLAANKRKTTKGVPPAVTNSKRREMPTMATSTKRRTSTQTVAVKTTHTTQHKTGSTMAAEKASQKKEKASPTLNENAKNTSAKQSKISISAPPRRHVLNGAATKPTANANTSSPAKRNVRQVQRK